VFDGAGLLVNEPPGPAGLPFISSSDYSDSGFCRSRSRVPTGFAIPVILPRGAAIASEFFCTHSVLGSTVQIIHQMLVFRYPLQVSVGALPASRNTWTMSPVVNACTTAPLAGSSSAVASRTFIPVIRLISCRNESAELANNCR
jgi:hypothetical protein